MQMQMQMGSVDFDDEETPFTSSSPSASASASARKGHTFNFETSSVLPHVPSDLPKSSSIFKLLRMRHMRSIYVVLIKAKINMLLPFGPLAIALHYLTGKHVCICVLSPSKCHTLTN